MEYGQLKISGLDWMEVERAAKAVVSANTGKYSPAFDQGSELIGKAEVHTATIHKLSKLDMR